METVVGFGEICMYRRARILTHLHTRVCSHALVHDTRARMHLCMRMRHAHPSAFSSMCMCSCWGRCTSTFAHARMPHARVHGICGHVWYGMFWYRARVGICVLVRRSLSVNLHTYTSCVFHTSASFAMTRRGSEGCHAWPLVARGTTAAAAPTRCGPTAVQISLRLSFFGCGVA